ncbi:GH1 family beta-glucosidase [Roseobacter litoralis]|uniref:Beta-glucosidase n=1 Tax=Roseobacter litoralis (strain ATCC 49566 / DSM 6996 / JCM 21268 / NBRC 15278 / OCh 149) TaxID=391595 RepID=F7ZA00_ROSLO|nr:GH1 family beta-glucosidase [Roseobacter litoralis]AEI94153.1 beta-glucosidase BglA [Roseobacter litoralis Och 149]
MDFSRSTFPPDFLFAAATSSYQIEGHGFGGAGPTHWDTFAATPGNVVRAEHGQIACDHYNRWEEDLDLMQAMGLDAYRFSTSWARVLPEGRGTVNQKGLDFYDRLVDGMLARDLKPMATLYHWELPAALADLGGWRNPDIAHWLADFATIVMERIGDRVFSAAPINEPWCVAWLSHFMGLQAPGLRDIRATAHAMHHVLTAHGRCIQAMRAIGMNNLGAVCNFEYVQAATDTPEASEAARRYEAIYNRFFVGGLFQGAYPDEVLEGLGPHMPKGWENDFDLIGQKLDWFGVNYYTCKRIAADSGPWPSLREVEGPLPKTQIGWEIKPEGLEHILTWLQQNYTGALPLYVTENGMANADDTTTPDDARMDYLDAHLAASQRAIAVGVPLAGYTFWSLMDNYEWSLGYEKRFGLVHVDFDTLQRTPKASYHAIARALAR